MQVFVNLIVLFVSQLFGGDDTRTAENQRLSQKSTRFFAELSEGRSVQTLGANERRRIISKSGSPQA